MNIQLTKQILFATDFSDGAARAQEYATSLAIAWDAGMDVLHVLEGSAGIPLSAADISSPEQIHEEVTPQLDEMQKQIARMGVAVTMRKVRGIPSVQINQAAKERGIDLVVLGIEGRSGRDYRLLGRTAEQVTKTAPCPVLAVPSLREGAIRQITAVESPIVIQHILTPVDFSSPSLASLKHAIEFANQVGAKMTLLHVLEPVFHDLTLGLGQIEQEPVKRAYWEGHLAKLAATVRSFGVPAESVVCGGIPSHSILACALQRRCDLIVMGTHGRRSLSNGRFGSVAEAVLRQAACPVLTVRNPKFSPDHRRAIVETALAT